MNKSNNFQNWCIENNKQTLIKEWNYEKNADLDPKAITYGSVTKVWWRCEFGHEWKARVDSRCINGNGCPTCAKQLVTSFSEQAIFYYISQIYNDAENGNREILKGKELDIFIPSIRTAIEYDGANWHKTEYEKEKNKNKLCKELGIRLIRIREQGLYDFDDCECISRNNNSLAALEKCLKDLMILLDIKESKNIDIERDQDKIINQYLTAKRNNSLSILYPEIAKEWNVERNGTLSPSMVEPMSNIKVWWIGKCGHEWQATVNNRISKGSGCPYCSVPPVKILKGFNDLKTTNPDIAKEWDYEKNNNLSPEEVFSGSSRKVWWKCSKGHSWEGMIATRVSKGIGCPYCSGRKIVPKQNDLMSLYPLIASEIHPVKNGNINPELLSPKSVNKIWWLGKCGHEWYSTIYSRTQNGNGCPFCAKNSVKKIKNVTTGIIYDNMARASEDTGISKSKICLCCQGKRKSAGGYHWEYIT